MPKRARSRPVGSWPATRRECATARGTRICAPRQQGAACQRSPPARLGRRPRTRAPRSSSSTSNAQVALAARRGRARCGRRRRSSRRRSARARRSAPRRRRRSARRAWSPGPPRRWPRRPSGRGSRRARRRRARTARRARRRRRASGRRRPRARSGCGRCRPGRARRCRRSRRGRSAGGRVVRQRRRRSARVAGVGVGARQRLERWSRERCALEPAPARVAGARSRSSAASGASAPCRSPTARPPEVERCTGACSAHLGADERAQQPADLVAPNVRTPRRSSTSAASASSAPISPVPRTQPMRGAISCARAPQRARCERGEQDLERGLRLAVGAVAAEAAVVGRQREQHGARASSAADEPLHAEQLQAQRDLEGRRRRRSRRRRSGSAANGATIVGASGSRRRSGRPRAPAPGVGEPGRERVDVGERGEVRGQDVQLGARTGRRAVQLAVPAPPRGRVGRRGDDDGRAAAQQGRRTSSAAIEPGRRAGDERDLAAQVGAVLSETPSSATSAGVTFGGAVTGASGAPEARPRMRSRGRASSGRRADDRRAVRGDLDRRAGAASGSGSGADAARAGRARGARRRGERAVGSVPARNPRSSARAAR